MNTYKLRNYIERVFPNDMWEIEGYKFPVFVEGNINLKCLYEKQLLNYSSFEESWENYVKNTLVPMDWECDKYASHRQFPFLIDDKKLWKWCLSQVNEKLLENEEYVNRRCFFVDFFYYRTGLIVELDGADYHDSDYDCARDYYIHRRYGVITLRASHLKDNFAATFIEASAELYKVAQEDRYVPVDYPVDSIPYVMYLWKRNHKPYVEVFNLLERRNTNVLSVSELPEGIDIQKLKKLYFSIYRQSLLLS